MRGISRCDLVAVIILHVVDLNLDSCGSCMQALVGGAILFEARAGIGSDISIMALLCRDICPCRATTCFRYIERFLKIVS